MAWGAAVAPPRPPHRPRTSHRASPSPPPPPARSFRQAYRDERQSSASPLDAPSADREPPSSEASAAGAAFRRRISRVVVEYDDVKATYHDPDDYPPAGQASNAAEGVFFDTDGFWSGAISWY